MKKLEIEKLFRESVQEGETIWLEQNPAEVVATAVDGERTKISFIKNTRVDLAEPAYLRRRPIRADHRQAWLRYVLWISGVLLLIFALKNFWGL